MGTAGPRENAGRPIALRFLDGIRRFSVRVDYRQAEIRQRLTRSAEASPVFGGARRNIPAGLSILTGGKEVVLGRWALE